MILHKKNNLNKNDIGPFNFYVFSKYTVQYRNTFHGPNHKIYEPSKFAVLWNLRCVYSTGSESLHNNNLDFCDLNFAVYLEDPMSAKIGGLVYIILEICEN